MRWATAGVVLSSALLAAGPAFASGGGHVVDDAAVETPGTCHVETWVALSSDGGGLVNGAPACTSKAWPDLELGGFVSHGWNDESEDTVIGLSPKLMLRSEDRGVGIGIAASVGYGVRQGRFETASVILPVTIPAGENLRFNLNAGWLWTREGHRHDMFLGAQAEIALRKNLNLMVESFTRTEGKVGGQAGLRWTVAGGSVDFDLIDGRYVDGITRNAVTFGVTVRG
jgi:hypothetical protein